LNNGSFFKQNLQLLTAKYPDFKCDITDRFKPSDSMEIFDSAAGQPTAKIEGSWVHSSRYPEKEAGKVVKSGLKSGSGICMIYGFGLAYHIEAVMEQYPAINVIIIEPDPGLFLKALEARDYSKIISSEKTGFLLDVKPSAIPGILSSYGRTAIQTLKLRSIYDLHLDYYEKVDEEVKTYISKKETNMNTLNRFGKAWVRNLFRNIELFRKAGDAGVWYNKFSGFPALVLAAGPSLDELLPELPGLRKSHVLICVDTALKAVAATGTVPDFLVVVDPQYLNTRHLDNCLDSPLLKNNTILISESSTHPSVFRNSFLPVFFFKSIFPLGKLLERHAGIKSELGAGGSVSTTAWDFARRLGCSEISAAGLDLGFAGGNTHCRNSLSPFISLLLSKRLSPLETINFHSVNDAAPFPVKNNEGGTTLTDRRLIIYKWWFEEQIKRQNSSDVESNAQLFNTSPRGVSIDGMKLIDIEKLTAHPECRDKIDRIKTSVTSSYGRMNEDGQKAVIDTITAIISECSRLENICSEALSILDGLETEDAASFTAEALKRLSELDDGISASPSKELTGFIIQPVLNDIIDNDAPVLENSCSLYKNLRSACEFHRTHAQQAVKRFADVQA
jgi:hypothetical protein